MRRSRGKGLFNTAINKLPFEVHIPGYRFCGPGTRLQKRLARGDAGINPLDEACKQHDIAYDRYSDLANRHQADQILASKALSRARSGSTPLGERLAALGVGAAMKAKVKLGMGRRRQLGRRCKKVLGKGMRGNGLRKQLKTGGALSFRDLVRSAWDAVKTKRPIDLITAAKLALNRIRGMAKNITSPRIIPVPKTGGFLPLIPLFAGLSALGALSGGAAGIAKAVQDANAAKSQLQEAQRHNQAMEAIAIGKGFFLKPYRKGFGLYLNKQKKNFG